jgi:hypothetical protein
MSASEMLDMCVRFIARRHHMLTQEHVEILNEVWELYESQEVPPLPPSPVPECEEQEEFPSRSEYVRTCDADGCTYECAEACGSSAAEAYSSYSPQAYGSYAPPIDSCLYGCAYSCGAKQGEYCCAQFDVDGNQLPPVAQSVVNTAIDTDDEMPPLISFAELARQKGLMNPEEAEPEETEIVETVPKVKPTFPYDHPMWPSPRAKMMVRYILGPRAREVLNVKTLTHDICMRWLANHYRLSHEELLKTSIYKLHNPERASWNGGHGTWESVPGKKSYWDLPPQCRCPYCKDDRCYY